MLRKYLRGTQGRPELCFDGFSTYGESNRPLSWIQPSGATEETGPTFVMFLRCMVLRCQLCVISDARDGSHACTCVRKRLPPARYDGDTSLGCSRWGFYLFVPILDTTFPAQSTVHYTRSTSSRRSWGLLHVVTNFVPSPTIGMVMVIVMHPIFIRSRSQLTCWVILCRHVRWHLGL